MWWYGGADQISKRYSFDYKNIVLCTNVFFRNVLVVNTACSTKCSVYDE